MTIRFIETTGTTPGKLADCELSFDSGPLAGLKLVGFAVWTRRNGGRNVTVPARQYSVNGERRSFALLRPTADAHDMDRLRDVILDAYRQHERAAELENGNAIAAMIDPAHPSHPDITSAQPWTPARVDAARTAAYARVPAPVTPTAETPGARILF